MDNKIYTEQQVRGIVKEGFWDLRCIIRQNVKKQWKKMTKSEQYAAARSLALLNHVAKKPEMYFAPEYTSAQWEARAKEYAKKMPQYPCDGYIKELDDKIIVNMGDKPYKVYTFEW